MGALFPILPDEMVHKKRLARTGWPDDQLVTEEFKELTGWIKRTGKNLEAAAARIRPTIADEHYLSGDEVCRMLHVSKRTLQTLRDEKAIPYTSITSVGGKLLYPESGLYEVLKKNYKDFRRYLK